jgi:Flp pilus assembly protein TadG
MFRLFGRNREEGASMVEFALVLPLLLLLVFGIMEAGWAFAQQVEVRNAAREGARLAVVDFPTPGSGDSSAIVTEVCARASLSADRATVSIRDTGSNSAQVTVAQDYESLTGFLPVFNSMTIRSVVEMRIERDEVTWVDVVDGSCA